MANTIQTLIHLDPDARKLLELIAEHGTDEGENPQLSRTIRRMIRAEAHRLGIVAPKPDPKSNKQKAAA